MKKLSKAILVIILSMFMIFVFTACGNGNNGNGIVEATIEELIEQAIMALEENGFPVEIYDDEASLAGFEIAGLKMVIIHMAPPGNPPILGSRRVQITISVFDTQANFQAVLDETLEEAASEGAREDIFVYTRGLMIYSFYGPFEFVRDILGGERIIPVS